MKVGNQDKCLQAARDTEREERKVRRRKRRVGGLRMVKSLGQGDGLG